MNFLAEVLSSAEKIEVDEIHQKVPDLKLSVETIKEELIQYMDNVYIKYSGRPKQNRELFKKVQGIDEEMATLKKHGENAVKKQLVKSNKDLIEQVDTLTSIDFTLRVLSKLCFINENLLEFAQHLKTADYLKCKEIICDLEVTLEEIPDDEQLLSVIEGVKVTVEVNKNDLCNKLSSIFREKIITFEKVDTAGIKILSHIEPLEQALIALYYDESVIFVLSEFAKFLWNHIFVPIVDNVVVIEVEQNDTFSLIQVNIVDINRKSKYSDIFSNLKIVLKFLEKHFNFLLTSSSELTTLEYIGLDIRDNLSELIIKHCIEETIPSTIEGLKNYNTVTEEIKNVEQSLKNCKIFPQNTTFLTDYANNIDALYIKKKCKRCFKEVEQIMKKDLHDMEEIGVPYDPDNLLGCDGDQFLQCSISKNVIELLNYCEKILQEAVNGSEMNAGILLVTIQNILRNYIKFVPEYHNKLLKTIPQQVALFHNNCSYISYQLTHWNIVYLMKLPSNLNISCVDFEFEINQLRQAGSDLFSTYVNGQINQIQEIMKNCGLNGAVLEGDLPPITEKCVRQCLRQQELLKTVWQKVLSYPIYNDTLGLLLNSLCNCIIKPILNFEDIQSVSAEQLVEIVKIIISRGPKLFTNSKEIKQYVNSWYKLIELNFVLGASLININDRWAGGKGPLALEFKPAELKSLIRALFENTDWRASILAKIQE